MSLTQFPPYHIEYLIIWNPTKLKKKKKTQLRKQRQNQSNEKNQNQTHLLFIWKKKHYRSLERGVKTAYAKCGQQQKKQVWSETTRPEWMKTWEISHPNTGENHTQGTTEKNENQQKISPNVSVFYYWYCSGHSVKQHSNQIQHTSTKANTKLVEKLFTLINIGKYKQQISDQQEKKKTNWKMMDPFQVLELFYSTSFRFYSHKKHNFFLSYFCGGRILFTLVWWSKSDVASNDFSCVFRRDNLDRIDRKLDTEWVCGIQNTYHSIC